MPTNITMLPSFQVQLTVGTQSILFHQVGQLGLIQFRAVQYIVQYMMRLRRDGEDSLFCVGT